MIFERLKTGEYKLTEKMGAQKYQTKILEADGDIELKIGEKGVEENIVYFTLNKWDRSKEDENSVELKYTLKDRRIIKLTFNKVDYVNNSKGVENAGFVFKHGDKYLKMNYTHDSGYVTDADLWTTSIEEAYIFSTDGNGQVVIEVPIDESADWQLIEVQLADGYTNYMESIENCTTGKTEFSNSEYPYYGAQMSIGYTSAEVWECSAKASNRKGTLEITKIDNETGETLEGITFSLTRTDGKVDESTVRISTGGSLSSFTTDSSGYVKIEGLDVGSWTLTETGTLRGYQLRIVEGKVTTERDSGKDLELQGSPNKTNYLNFTIEKNDDKEIGAELTNTSLTSITGFVWEDQSQGKVEDDSAGYDSLYNNGEPLIAGVTVTIRGDGVQFYDGPGKPSSVGSVSTVTGGDGSYKFEEVVRYQDLDKIHIEFDYSTAGKDEKGDSYGGYYIPVAFDNKKTNGSRALYDKVAYKDEDLTGVVKTGEGTEYGLTGEGVLYNNFYKEPTIEHINLGIKKIPDAKYQISETISHVTVGLNGYTQTYNVDAEGTIYDSEEYDTVATVVLQDSKELDTYVHTLYPTDISYDKLNADRPLEVNITYRIDVTNTTIGNIPELYMEQYLTLTSLTNKFDNKRLELNDKNWTANGDTASLNDLSGFSKILPYSSSAPNQNTVTTYITFKLTDDAKDEIFENGQRGVDTKEYVTEAEADGYHIYKRKDYEWDSNITAENEHQTRNKKVKDTSIYLYFKLGEGRIITGTVFEDSITNTTDGESLGDGIYDNAKENVVKDVKVELVGLNGEQTTLYGVNDKFESDLSKTTKAVTYSDSSGYYAIPGIVPGEYYLRFTYGDGTQKIVDLKGKEIKDVDMSYYKSTIVTSEAARKGLMSNFEDKEWVWYKDLEGDNYNTAVDDLETRRKYNTGDESIKTITASTARMSVTIEHTKEEKLQPEINGKEAFGRQYYKISKMNFGIVKQQNSELTIQKYISKIKLTNAEGSVIFDGNPLTDDLTGVKAFQGLIDGKECGYIHNIFAEVPDSQMYGSNLQITYNITIKNVSDRIYYEFDDKYLGWYYKFGLHDDKYSKEVEISTDDIKDYATLVLNFENENSKMTLKEDIRQRPTDDAKIDQIIWEWFNQIGQQGLSKYQLDDFNGVHIGYAGEKTSTILGEKLLSKDEDDTTFKNATAIIKCSFYNGFSSNTDSNEYKTAKASLETLKPPVKPDPANTKLSGEYQSTVAVTPPTGQDKQVIIIYLAAIIATLVLLTGGVIFIKKKVL